MRKYLFLIAFCILICLTAVGQAESISYSVDDNHIDGYITVNDYTFPIDALYLYSSETPSEVHYERKSFDVTLWQAATKRCFSIQDNSVSPQLDSQQSVVSFINANVPNIAALYPNVLPYTQFTLDEQLTFLKDACLSFLHEVEVSVSSIPLTCNYIIIDKDSGKALRLPSEKRKICEKNNGYIEIWFALGYNEISVIPHLQLPRYNGSTAFNGLDECYMLTPGAKFYFALSGELLSYEVANINIRPRDHESYQIGDWEQALMTFLKQYTSKKVVQNNLKDVSYIVSSVRVAYDATEENSGLPGWMFTLSGASQSDQSPTGYEDRFSAGFVYGGKQ